MTSEVVEVCSAMLLIGRLGEQAKTTLPIFGFFIFKFCGSKITSKFARFEHCFILSTV